MNQTQLLVIGAGPYALSVAALARERGIQTVVLGRPMGFWRQNMPEGMFLRSGPDWHLDPAAVHTLEAYLEQRGIRPDEVDPIPVGVFLDYADWFRSARESRSARTSLTPWPRPMGGSRQRCEAASAFAPTPWWPPRESAITRTFPAGRRRCRQDSPLIPATWCALMTWPERAC